MEERKAETEKKKEKETESAGKEEVGEGEEEELRLRRERHARHALICAVRDKDGFTPRALAAAFSNAPMLAFFDRVERDARDLRAHDLRSALGRYARLPGVRGVIEAEVARAGASEEQKISAVASILRGCFK